MEGFPQECDQVDDFDHPTEKLDQSVYPLEESSLKPEGNDGSSLDQDETRTLQEGSNDSDKQEEEDGKDNGNGGDESSEESDDGDFPLEEIIDDDDDWVDYYYDQPLVYASFERVYRCFPLSFVDKTHLEIGNKIIMPAEALVPLMATQISMPMQFEIQNQSTGRVSHCGVIEFTGEEEGAVFLPDWMMKNMQLHEGDPMFMKNKNLKKGTYIKLQPHTTDFLGISNPKDVLEENLQKFSCLTMGDTIMISHEGKNFYVDIIETTPSAAISIIDADCNVDFAPPLDYKEPEKCAAKIALEKEQEEATQKPKFKPFTGLARRLNEEPCSTKLDSDSLPNEQPSAAAALEKREAAGAKPMSKRSPEGLVFQTDRNQPQNKGKELTSENVQAETLKDKPNPSKFQPFTGKKYTLAG
ncbi:ubiquitin fusion degradation protein 1 homolog [Durio zibethinus]|uniref:Ubiquitin fusion degradation protein 1 homolog n=1 Tax=Durio zibethinus TaxID=66656 RepID=A0A6P6APM5_DURZI|nr:ubiquitin fusion degradation protein 1 homolog [Durio zibethinus]